MGHGGSRPGCAQRGADRRHRGDALPRPRCARSRARSPGRLRRRRARAVGGGVACRADLPERPAVDEHDVPGALVADADRRFLEELRLHRARLGPGPRDRNGAGRPARDRARLERVREPRVPRADRVPASDPVRRAHPAALPDARDDAEERALPRGIRRVLAAARADHVRRARRRPADDRHGPLVRRRAARAPLPHEAAERAAVHSCTRSLIRTRSARCCRRPTRTSAYPPGAR